MKLENLLAQKRSAIVRKWFNILLDSYPADTSRFLRREKNQFANPVGYTISQGLEGLFDQLLHEINADKVFPFLDNVIRVRAVQDFSASQAVAFIFDLKTIIREELEKEIRENRVSADEFSTLDSRIDCLALLSFDIYMECREKVYSLKANEVRNRTYMLLERTNRVSGIPTRQKDPNSGNSTGSTQGRGIDK